MSDSEDLKILAEDLLDFLNGLEASIVKMKMQLNKLFGLEAEAKAKFSWNPDKISWQETEGFKGRYEKSSDVNSLDFKELLKDLASHNGKLSRNGFFYWVFKNGSTIGRKKREGKI